MTSLFTDKRFIVLFSLYMAQGLVALPNDQFFLGGETGALIRTGAPIIPYIILLIVLVIRPDGLFGQKRIERI